MTFRRCKAFPIAGMISTNQTKSTLDIYAKMKETRRTHNYKALIMSRTYLDSLGGVFRVIPATPLVAGETGAASNSTQPLDAGNSIFKVTLESGYENLQLHS
ncbi:hypothetical protein POM88_052029 [Heracleum sosnowskyi]|uniref:Uncharacterized protein n=1 Tax=Heracleum sosnowskyi TaxID=360622 RepID=A0AAD8GSF1_9APIA|nr:hypothetical protein POM88_052029 [Heracleum sosnowskyi]